VYTTTKQAHSGQDDYQGRVYSIQTYDADFLTSKIQVLIDFQDPRCEMAKHQDKEMTYKKILLLHLEKTKINVELSHMGGIPKETAQFSGFALYVAP
jgi:hypothetical protein